MTQCVLDLPDEVLNQAKQFASDQNTSVERFFIQLIHRRMQEGILEERARRADLNACRAVLNKIPDDPVEAGDRLPANAPKMDDVQ